MNAAYPDTRPRPDEVGALPSTTQAIEHAIERLTRERPTGQFFGSLVFPRDLEALYQAETRHVRSRELRFTLSAAAAFQFISAFTDRIFVPDLGGFGFLWRILVAAAFLYGAFTLHRLSAEMREIALCGYAFFCIAVFTAIPIASHAPLAPFGLFWTVLVIVYCNTTFPMPFRFAWPFNLLAIATILLPASLDPRIGLDLLGAISLLVLVPVLFTLIANYRIERSSRLSYLFAAHEALRLRAIARDRDQFQTVSNTDALTGLANRGRFDRRCAQLLNPDASPGTRVSLLLLDVDFFKPYNDRYGHIAGDACLKSIADVLSNVMRGRKDFPFRYGGEEFGALILEVNEEQLVAIAHRVRAAVEEAALPHEGRPDSTKVITVSVGAAVVTSGRGASVRHLIDRADRALYEAKRSGRNRVISAASLPEAPQRRKVSRAPAPAPAAAPEPEPIASVTA